MTQPTDQPIYLDYHATTPLDPRAAEKMRALQDAGAANPHSTGHAPGWRAAEAVETARREVASMTGARADEIVFTSGASEANNIAILGTARQRRTGRIVTSAIEHPSVLEACRYLGGQNEFELDIAGVGEGGLADLAALEAVLTPETILVSVMLANNEIGTIQPAMEIAALVRARAPDAVFHIDATQAAGRIPVDVATLDCDLLSLSGHKLHGPMGVGALYLRPGVEIAPISFGGAQEAGIRPGTVPAPLVAGFGEACRIARKEGLGEQARIADLRDKLLAGLRELAPGLKVNGTLDPRLAGNLNVSFPDKRAEALLQAAPGIAASTGSACATGTQKPSHVLKALGLSPARIDGAVRFGLGRFTTEDEIARTIAAFAQALEMG